MDLKGSNRDDLDISFNQWCSTGDPVPKLTKDQWTITGAKTASACSADWPTWTEVTTCPTDSGLCSHEHWEAAK